MRHVSTWLQAAVLPPLWNVCGVRCRALSLWHAFVLSQTGNPYLFGQPCDRDAACSLLLWCSRGYAEGARLFRAPYARRRAVRRIARRLARMDWGEADRAVCDYLAGCMRTPGHKRKEPKNKGQAPRLVAAPMEWVLADALGGTAAAWDTPYAVARCRFDARRDAAGEDESLESLEEEARFDAYIERQRAGGGK